MILQPWCRGSRCLHYCTLCFFLIAQRETAFRCKGCKTSLSADDVRMSWTGNSGGVCAHKSSVLLISLCTWKSTSLFKCMLYFRVKSDHNRSGVHCRPSIITAFCFQYNLLLLYNALFGDEIGRKAKPCCDDTHMVSHPTEFQRWHLSLGCLSMAGKDLVLEVVGCVTWAVFASHSFLVGFIFLNEILWTLKPRAFSQYFKFICQHLIHILSGIPVMVSTLHCIVEWKSFGELLAFSSRRN